MFQRLASLAFLVFILTPALSQLPSFSWVKVMGGNSWDDSFSMTRDISGNTYISGYFSGTADFDPGTGVSNLTASGTENGFIVKLDAADNFIWVKQLKGEIVEPFDIKIDAFQNIYVTGYFTGLNADFDPGSSTNYLNATGGYDVFILKLSASGDFTWAKNIGGYGNDVAYNILFDNASNVYITGVFGSATDFDPGPGVFNISCSGVTDVFILMLTSGGEFLWCKAFGGYLFDVPWHTVQDATGNLYIAGTYGAIVDFDPGPGVASYTSAGNRDAFLLKLTSQGEFCWVKCIGGIELDEAEQLFIANTGEVYLAGYFDNTVDLDPGPGVEIYTAPIGHNTFITKYDTAGNYIWTKVFAGDGNDPTTIVKDLNGNLLITGHFSGNMDLDPGPGQFNIYTSTASTGHVTFMVRLTSSGDFISGSYLPSTNHTIVSRTIIDPSGEIYMGGMFAGTSDFDPGSGTHNVTSNSADVFLLKLTMPSTLPVQLLQFTGTQTTDRKIKLDWTVIVNDAEYFIIERSSNGQGFFSIGSIKSLFSINQDYSFIDQYPSNGSSLYRLKIIHSDGSITYSKVIKIEAGNSNRLIVFPNPAKQLLYVIPNEISSPASVDVIDATGRVILSGKYPANTVIYSVDIKTIPRGAYTLVLRSVKNVLTTRFVKQ
jgi:hypothetical protein